jgi:sensor c-di-GMP phosphodiesterase-like protein
MDVKYGQGYLFSKPLALAEVEKFFDSYEYGTSGMAREDLTPIIRPPLITNV